MSKFYLTDPNIINAALTDKEFRIYHYCCSNYNVQKRSAYIRIVDIGGLFQLTKKEVEEILIKLSEPLPSSYSTLNSFSIAEEITNKITINQNLSPDGTTLMTPKNAILELKYPTKDIKGKII